ncbi:short transient receptor potential channel 4-like [Diachasma alloeum]|uniref:short transient receptor potential channel 4-like n=1 Tax=Diachasma alloeum TaxID=454923 RepID=UPI000738117E|nr:short transient receptor potential channel 4-like [Diachasma alloeum]
MEPPPSPLPPPPPPPPPTTSPDDEERDQEVEKIEDTGQIPGVILPQLEELEKQFFELVASANVTGVQEFLGANREFKINSANFQNLSALHIAVKERDVAMVELLLSRDDIDCGDTALHAIRDNEQKIAMMILDKMESQVPGSQFTGPIDSSEFPDATTPMDVAASCGHFEMIKMLAARGHVIEEPHPPSCCCDEICKPERDIEDPLTLDNKRLYRYRAVANPAYICHTSPDPILKAFQLSVVLDKAASFERELYKSYKQLSQEVAYFAAELIGCARKAEEVEIVLKQRGGNVQARKFIFPRLLFAVECEQKLFVAHPNVQQVIETRWIGNWYEWKAKSGTAKVFTVLQRIPLLPIIAMWLLIAPNSKIAKKWQIPVNRYISSVASYLIFLVFVYLEANVDKKNQLRGPPNSGYEVIICFYVISYVWAAIRLCMTHGPRRYFGERWNLYEVGMLALFILTFVFWALAAIDVRRNGQRDLERKYWHMFDPTLVAEGLFCIATIMAFFKLLFVCQLDYNLGPLQMSLGKMIKDVTKFLFLFLIIITAFAAGLAKLYQYYDGMVQIDDESKIKTQQVASFVDFRSSLRTLFWAVFCMSAIESADVIIENLPGETESETIINKHSFTEGIGYFAFAGFEFMTVIVVLNMLIACMSNTFTAFTDNVDVEWTFGRTEVYIDIMAQNALPPPFNFLPTGSDLRWLAEYIKLLIKPTETKKAKWDLKHCCFIENLSEDDDEKFGEVMGHLVMRYFRKKEAEVEKSDTEGLRKDLMELKSILKDALSAP